LFAALAIFLPCTSSRADDLEAVILYESPNFCCINGSIQFFGNNSTGPIERVEWDKDNDGNPDYASDWDGGYGAYVDPLISWSDLGGGEYTVKLTVFDGDEPEGSDYTTASPFYVGEVIILGEPILRTYQVAFHGQHSLPASASPVAHAYAWEFDSSGLVDSTTGEPTWDFGSSGWHTAKLGVTYGTHTPAWYCEKIIQIYLPPI
jgi:PKD repeat protein